jgi:hypothetical protein
MLFASSLLPLHSLRACGTCTDAGLAHLSGLALNTLDVDHCRNISDAGLVHISAMSQLHSLSIPRCPKITDAGLAHLKGLHLQTLNMCVITDAGLVHVSAMSQLHTLTVMGCVEITDAGLAHLKGLQAADATRSRFKNWITRLFPPFMTQKSFHFCGNWFELLFDSVICFCSLSFFS